LNLITSTAKQVSTVQGRQKVQQRRFQHQGGNRQLNRP